MQITETNTKTHPLLQHCKPPVVAVVLGAACLTIWGLMFPMVLFAQAQSLPGGMRQLRAFSTSTYSRRNFGENESGTSSPSQDFQLMKSKMGRDSLKTDRMVFRTSRQQKIAKQHLQSLTSNLVAFQKQIATLSTAGVTVPTSISNDLQQFINDLKTLNQSVASSQVNSGTAVVGIPSQVAPAPVVPPPVVEPAPDQMPTTSASSTTTSTPVAESESAASVSTSPAVSSSSTD